MLKIFNSLGKKIEVLHPVNRDAVSIFTCGPSVYQRAHIGNFRTFLFEDILVRYLEYSGYTVVRGMNFTDLEDKAIREAEKKGISLKQLTDKNISRFMREMKLLGMKKPDFLPRASENIEQASEIISLLLNKGMAYRHKGNIYFDVMKFKGFGKLYGLDLSKWPAKKKRFHKDTYPGIQWNLGDFILWHGCKTVGKYCWETETGKGRPSWNVQDPAMISRHFRETLSIYCGGADNLFRHHDYTLAILESVRKKPAARYWMHCEHLFINGQKMSKSRGNVLYTDDLKKLGFSMKDIRCLLICSHYRQKFDYSEACIKSTAGRLKDLRKKIRGIIIVSEKNNISGCFKNSESGPKAAGLEGIFRKHMDNDLHVGEAFEGICSFIFGIDAVKLDSEEASGIIRTLKEIDRVLMVMF